MSVRAKTLRSATVGAYGEEFASDSGSARLSGNKRVAAADIVPLATAGGFVKLPVPENAQRADIRLDNTQGAGRIRLYVASAPASEFVSGSPPVAISDGDLPAWMAANAPIVMTIPAAGTDFEDPYVLSGDNLVLFSPDAIPAGVLTICWNIAT